MPRNERLSLATSVQQRYPTTGYRLVCPGVAELTRNMLIYLFRNVAVPGCDLLLSGHHILHFPQFFP